MSVCLTEQEMEMTAAAKKYAMKSWNPYSSEWEMERNYPDDLFQKAADAGYMGLASSLAIGGKGMGFLHCFLTYEGLAYGDPAITTYLHIHNGLTMELENWYDIDDEIRSLLPALVKGEKQIAFALTEESGGSDPASGTSFCQKKDGYYILNGEKVWVSNSLRDDYYLIILKDRETQETLMFLVDRETKGLQAAEDAERIAGNAVACGRLRLKDCKVPENRVLTHKGLKYALKAIDIARLFLSASSLGLIQRTLDITQEYLSERKTFGKPLISNQVIQWSMAEMSASLEACRWLAYHTASILDAGVYDSVLIAKCKLQATTTATRITKECQRFFGANGLKRYSEIARLAGLARVFEIMDGTNEIQKMVIGRSFTVKK